MTLTILKGYEMKMILKDIIDNHIHNKECYDEIYNIIYNIQGKKINHSHRIIGHPLASIFLICMQYHENNMRKNIFYHLNQCMLETNIQDIYEWKYMHEWLESCGDDKYHSMKCVVFEKLLEKMKNYNEQICELKCFNLSSAVYILQKMCAMYGVFNTLDYIKLCHSKYDIFAIKYNRVPNDFDDI